MKFFTIKCHNCGAQNPLDEDEMSNIKVYFHKGTPNTLDRIVFYCGNCGNKEERAISWPKDILPQPQSPDNEKGEGDGKVSMCKMY